jgi:hypothetical protein
MSEDVKVLRKIANSISHFVNGRGRRHPKPLHVVMSGIWDVVNLPLWAVVVSRNGDCGFANGGAYDEWDGCDRQHETGELKCRFYHCCAGCRSTEHTAFETDDDDRYVCPSVRALADAGHDVLDDMAVLRAASEYVTGSTDEWFAPGATRSNVTPEVFRRVEYDDE